MLKLAMPYKTKEGGGHGGRSGSFVSRQVVCTQGAVGAFIQEGPRRLPMTHFQQENGAKRPVCEKGGFGRDCRPAVQNRP